MLLLVDANVLIDFATSDREVLAFDPERDAEESLAVAQPGAAVHGPGRRLRAGAITA